MTAPATNPMHMGGSQLAVARDLQRRGFTMTEIAYELRVERSVVVANLYWRIAYPERVRP